MGLILSFQASLHATPSNSTALTEAPQPTSTNGNPTDVTRPSSPECQTTDVDSSMSERLNPEDGQNIVKSERLVPGYGQDIVENERLVTGYGQDIVNSERLVTGYGQDIVENERIDPGYPENGQDVVKTERIDPGVGHDNIKRELFDPCARGDSQNINLTHSPESAMNPRQLMSSPSKRRMSASTDNKPVTDSSVSPLKKSFSKLNF